MEFLKRAEVTRLSIGTLRRWRSTCRAYAVCEIKSTLEQRTRYVAIRVLRDDQRGETVISRHRTKHAAMRGCVKHFKRSTKRKRYAKGY